MNRPPVFILTTGHTGSSAFTKVLGAAGCWLGDCYVGADGKEFFENNRLLETNQLLLQNDKLTYTEFDIDARFRPFVQDATFLAQARAYLSQEVPDDVTPVFKDPRTALTWPVWSAVFPNAKWLWLRRAWEDVAQVAEPDKMLPAFQFRYKQIHERLGAGNMDRWCVMDYSYPPEQVGRSLSEFLGLDLERLLQSFKDHWRPQ